MSRIGKVAIKIPPQVTVKSEGGKVHIKGPKGEMVYQLPSPFVLEIGAEILSVKGLQDGKAQKALYGTARSHIANIVKGVSTGFERELDIVGVGFRAQMKGRELQLSLGVSHPIVMMIPSGVEVKVAGQNKIVVSGMNKHLVGLVASEIRALRPPDCYKGKGIKYVGEVVRMKVGKAASA